MAKSETLHIRVEPGIKSEVEATLKSLGLSTAEAVNIFLHQVVLNGGRLSSGVAKKSCLSL